MHDYRRTVLRHSEWKIRRGMLALEPPKIDLKIEDVISKSASYTDVKSVSQPLCEGLENRGSLNMTPRHTGALRC